MTRYTTEYAEETGDWEVVEWTQTTFNGPQVGRVIESHPAWYGAKTAANAYNLIHAFGDAE